MQSFLIDVVVSNSSLDHERKFRNRAIETSNLKAKKGSKRANGGDRIGMRATKICCDMCFLQINYSVNLFDQD